MRQSLLLVVALLVTVSLGYPWDPDFILTQHLATKSPYWPLADITRHPPAPSECKPIHFNLVNRHGNRNPGEDDIYEYERLVETAALYGEKLSFDWLRTFQSPVKAQDEGKLVPKGARELFDMAKRYMAAYPEVFAPAYDSDLYFMRATQEQRAMMSGDAFAYGLFERRGHLGDDLYEPHFILADTEAEDDILKYYDNCNLYKELVDENDQANLETEYYLDTIIHRIASRFTSIITTDGSWNITAADVLAFHSLCQTQAGIVGIEDEACTLFLQEELEDLEYWEDLDDYYTKSYPYPVSYEMTINLIKDVVESMQAAANKESRQVANLRFAHSSTVVPLTSAFGLYKDNFTLRHDSTQEQINNRLFRTSVMSPMGTNFAFILYECSAGAQFRVKVLQNEKETIVAGCTQLYCPLDTFTRAYSQYLEADFDEYCKN